MLEGNVLITGGTGSLGTAILERAEKEGWPAKFTILARGEAKMAQTLKQFSSVRGEIGDVRDLQWLRTIFPGHDYVIHTAALKVIPSAEVNVRETVLTNVVGSMNVSMASVECGIKRTCATSTDKVPESRTQYGHSKALMEGLLREADSWSATSSFNLVRYGNVLKSSSSVVPFFENLMKQNKPITLTHTDMYRFFLTMDDAIDLILDALHWELSGVVLVPKAKAISMLNLAKYIAGDKYPIEIIGIRPGEKLVEKMIHGGEAIHSKDIGKYFEIHHPASHVENHLPFNFEYVSDTCEQLTKHELFSMLNTYNPYGGPIYEND